MTNKLARPGLLYTRNREDFVIKTYILFSLRVDLWRTVAISFNKNAVEADNAVTRKM